MWKRSFLPQNKLLAASLQLSDASKWLRRVLPGLLLFLPRFLLEIPGRELSYFLQIGITEEVFVPRTEDEIHEFFEADQTVLQHEFHYRMGWKQLIQDLVQSDFERAKMFKSHPSLPNIADTLGFIRILFK